jgi:hypothetical protein
MAQILIYRCVLATLCTYGFLLNHSSGISTPAIPNGPYQARVNLLSLGGYGDGHHGDQTINTANVQINDYAIIGAVNGSDSNSVTIANGLFFNAGIFGGPVAGDEVMVHVSAKKGNVEDDLGKYAIRKLLFVNGATLIFDEGITEEFGLDPTLINNYYVQVVTIPQFHNLDIQAGGIIVPRVWDTTYGGGIVAFKASGTASINGKILTAGMGADRTDSINLNHSAIIDQFINVGNVFIVANNLIISDSARVGGTADGYTTGGVGGAGGYPTSAFGDGPGETGLTGTVGRGGAGGKGHPVTLPGSTTNEPGGIGSRGGKGGKCTWGSSTSDGSTGLFGGPNVIVMAKIASISRSAISTGGLGGGGGGGGANNVGGGGGGGGGGGAGGTASSNNGGQGGSGGGGGGFGPGGSRNIGANPAKPGDNQTGGDGGTSDAYNGFSPNSLMPSKGGSQGGAGYGGGGGGGGSSANAYGGGGGGGSGTGLAYIAAAVMEEAV